MYLAGYKPVVLITGCGSGLGWALAELFFKREDFRVVVTARTQGIEKLKATFPENERFRIRALDVTLDSQRHALVQEISDDWESIDILINNAGISYRSVVEHMTEADEFKQMSTNYLGPVGLIRSVLPHMRNRGRGKIINISSVSGMLAMPTMASYSASKHALEGMSEALWYEMRPLGIDVCLIQPGFINSDSFKNVYYSEASRPEVCGDGPYCDYYQNMTPFIEKLMRLSTNTPEKIALRVLKIVKRKNPPLWISATWDALFFYYFRRILPRRFLLPILFQLLPRAKSWGQGYSKRWR